MNNSELQFIFLDPGKWEKIILRGINSDKEGYGFKRVYTKEEIPVEYLPALESVMGILVGMAAPWQARMAWARLRHRADDYSRFGKEVIELVIEAMNEKGGRRIFTFSDYPELLIWNEEAVRFYKFFTREENE